MSKVAKSMPKVVFVLAVLGKTDDKTKPRQREALTVKLWWGLSWLSWVKVIASRMRARARGFKNTTINRFKNLLGIVF